MIIVFLIGHVSTGLGILLPVLPKADGVRGVSPTILIVEDIQSFKPLFPVEIPKLSEDVVALAEDESFFILLKQFSVLSVVGDSTARRAPTISAMNIKPLLQ